MNKAVSIASGLLWHQIRRTVGVLSTLAVMAAIGWAVYRQFINPQSTVKTEQKNIVKQVEDVTIDQRQVFPTKENDCYGISIGTFCLGLSREGKTKPNITIENKLE